MNQFLKRGLLGLWLLSGATALRAADPQTVPTQIAVYSDEGSGRSETDLVKALKANPRLKIKRITAEDIRRGILKDMDVVIHPGGSGGKQGRNLGPEGREAVRSFVRDGGGYLGVCAGAYLASADYDWSLHLLDAKVLDRKHWARGTGIVRVGISEAGQAILKHKSATAEIYYGQGPLLAPANRPDIPDYKPLALYETEIAKKGAPKGVMKGTTAFAAGEFGRGRVFCFSPHPEKTKGLEPLLYHAITWVASANPQKSQKPKSSTPPAETEKTTGDPVSSQSASATREDITTGTAKAKVKWAIVLHGGAGNPPSDANVKELQEYREGLKQALKAGKTILEKGGTSLDAVEATIRELEDNSLFNAGRGAVFNSAGGHELDASIMDGKTLDGGAVAGVRTVKNPIRLARLVMEKTRHILLSGEGAETFATEEKVDRVTNDSFSTERRRKSWERVRANSKKENAQRSIPPKPWAYGTVGCVALDAQGNLVAGTSTGGLTNKKFGRVGDSPILGAGTYADNETCGLSASGIGEQFIRHAACAQISQLMRYKNWSLQKAAEHVLNNRLTPGDGGVIGIDHTGKIVWVFTTPGMFRAAADADGRLEVRIRDES